MAWVAALAAASALVAGCDASTDSDQDPAGSPAASSTSTADEALRDAPEVGTCWQLPNDDLIDPDYWFDDSPQVPCTEPHNTETAYVFGLNEPTAEAAEALVNACRDSVRKYIDVEFEHWVPWAFGMLLSSRQQVADGASFLRCEARFPANLG
jgi:hypothetical protein